MCARRTKASVAQAALAALGVVSARSERGQARQAMAGPGRLSAGAGPSIEAPEDPQASVETMRPSKTASKKAAHDLQALGDALAGLPSERLAAIEMDPRLRDALHELARTRSHEGRRRQRQFVGKLMRSQDVEPLAQALAEAALGSARQTLTLHRAEALRARLVSEDEALTGFVREHGDCDAQRLRALIRSARREAELPPQQRHGRAWRELFQFIKPYVERHPTPPPSDNGGFEQPHSPQSP